jgi:HK97 gp10 family phage protein
MAGFTTLGGGGGKGAWSLQSHVVGMKEMNFIMKNMGKKLGKRAIMEALAKGAEPVIAEAKNNIRGHGFKGKKSYRSAHSHYARGVFMTKIKIHKKGALLKSIGITRDSKVLSLFVGPRKGIQFTNDAWYAHFVEFGT